MEIYKKLREARAFLIQLPGLKTFKDFDIAIEIGFHEQMKSPLTLKQLLLLNIASPATVRRHLDRMIENGIVKRVTPINDHRSVNLILSDDAHQEFKKCLTRLHSILLGLGRDPVKSLGETGLKQNGHDGCTDGP